MSYIEQDFGIPGEVDSFSAGSTGFTPSTPTAGDIVLAGTLNAAHGGTGQTVYAVGDLLGASTTTALSRIADIATGNALLSGGLNALPAYGKVGLTTHVTGVLPPDNGGTGVANNASSTQTISGNFGITWVVSAASNPTLPAGSFTVATTAQLASLVTGPASAVDGHLAVFNGTSGKIIKDGGAVPAGTVTAVSVATANGLAGSSSGGATPALTLSTSITGLLKGNGTAISAATPGTDYGSVSTVSVVSANGFAGSVANPTTTPAITLSTSINAPALAGNGTAIAAATTTGPGSTLALATAPASWTPIDSSGASLAFTSVSGSYVQIGKMVFASFKLTYPATASGAASLIGGLPTASVNSDFVTAPSIVGAGAVSAVLYAVPVKNTTTFSIYLSTSGAALTNAQLTTITLFATVIYQAA